MADGISMREIPPFWGRCHAEGKVRSLGPATGSFGMLGLCAEFEGDLFTYVIGVEVVPGGPALPAGTRTVEVPAATYAVFTCIGAMPDAIQNGWREIMGNWFPTSGYAEASRVNFELYPAFPEGDPRGNPESPDCVSEIWIPIRKLEGS